MTTAIRPTGSATGRAMVVLRLGEREDEADLRELVGTASEDGPEDAPVVCLLGDEVRPDAGVMADCEALALHRPVVVVRHPTIDPHLVNRDDPHVTAVVAAIRGAVGGVAQVDTPGLREVVVGGVA